VSELNKCSESEADQFEIGRFFGELDQWPGVGNPAVQVEWRFKPATYQRFVIVSARAGATATRALLLALALPVDHSSEPDSTDVQGFRWMNQGAVFQNAIATNPTVDGVWDQATLQIPPHCSGVKLSSTYAWVNAADRLRGVTVTLLHFTVQTREER